jgi:hypothetical protein
MLNSPDIILAIKDLIEPMVVAEGYKASIVNDSLWSGTDLAQAYISIDPATDRLEDGLSISFDHDKLIVRRYHLQARGTTNIHISLHEQDLLPKLVKAITTLITY